MATRALEKIRVMSRNKADTRSLRHTALPDTNRATVEVRAYGDEQIGAQMLLEALLGEFENSQESSPVKMSAAGPPSWTQPKSAEKAMPIAMGGLVGGFSGFSIALLIAAVVRASRPGSDSPPPLPTPE